MATIEERLKDAPPRLIVLAACGFARTVEHLLTDERSRGAIETAERFPDGLATLEEVRAAAEAAWAGVKTWEVEDGYVKSAEVAAALAAVAAASSAAAAEAAAAAEWAFEAAGAAAKARADVARAAVGAALPERGAKWTADKTAEAANQSILDCILPPRIQFPLPAHVKGLAATIYEKRDWKLMPVLADALEDAGCTNADILDHCHQPGPHVRGCWVVDLILGKE
jgi:hypothetical protein